MNFKKILGAAVASVMAVSTMAVAASAAHAGLIYQTNAWTFRNTIAQSKAVWWDADFGDQMEYDTWNVADVEITADGQYTASFEKNIMEDCKDGPESSFNFLKLQTDIAAADYPDLQITVDSLKIDGTEVSGATAAVLGQENLTIDDYSDGCNGISDTVVNAYTIGFINIWNEEQTCIDASSFGGKVEVTFTVSGFAAASTEDTEGNEGNEGNEGGNGDTNATTPDKNTPDTGVEGVAVVAGIAVLAAGAIVVAKKRK